MYKLFIHLLLLTMLLVSHSHAQKISLQDDIADGDLDEYSKIEAAFILSGITHADSLPRYLNWYEQLLQHINGLNLDNMDPIASAHTVFLYLHTTWLKTYALESTTLSDIVRNKEYNCVAATILFNLICEDLYWQTEAFETPTHVYTIFKNFERKLMVENTSSMGFDIMRNLKKYSKYLAQFYPKKEVLRIGLDRLYYHENSKGRIINNTELLGLLAYNRAYLARKNADFKSAYDYVLLAQQFNRDSRSNVNFEIGLYYNWGKELFANNDYIRAFSVFADGCYRYPDNDDFRKNTIAAFFNSLNHTWQTKDWNESARLIDEIDDLKILGENEMENVQKYLKNWQHYAQMSNENKILQDVQSYLQKIGN